MLSQFFTLVLRLLTIITVGWLSSGASPQSGTTVFVPLVNSSQNPAPGLSPTPVRTSTRTPTRTPTPSPFDPVILAAGDIARCGDTGDLHTAALIEKIPNATVLPLGDNAYESGTPQNYAGCYDPAWGAFKARTRPVPGNHDYLTAGAAGYFGYFGALAGDPKKGYYSYNLGSWHLLAINSDCSPVGGCGAGSAEEKWVRADLAASKAKCTLAYWHHAYYTALAKGGTGPAPAMSAIFTDLYNAGAEIVLSGHIHAYERFAPQNASGSLDAARGVVQFVVGTGGSNFTPLLQPLAPNTLAHQDTVFGVLKLTLHAASYTYQFLPISGQYTDSGTVNCH